MKVAITSYGASRLAQVDSRFRLAEYLIIYDSKLDKWDSISSLGEKYTVEQLIAYGVNALVTGCIGPTAFRQLANNHISTFTASAISVKEAVSELLCGNLKRLAAANAVDVKSLTKI